MQLHSSDIYIQKDRTARAVWIAHEYMMSLGCTDGYLRKERALYNKTVAPSFRKRDILPDTGRAWRWAKLNNRYWYAYDNIPDKAPAHYKSQLPSAEEIMTIALQEQKQEPNELENHFKDYLTNHYVPYLHQYNDCTSIQQRNLAKAAAIMEAAKVWVIQQAINLKKYDFINEFTALIEKYDVAYLPKNPRIFKNKIMELANGEAITNIVQLPRKGNNNAGKHSDEEIRSWVLQLRSLQGLNFSNAFIIRKIRKMCTLVGKPVPSDRWVGAIMEDHNTDYLTAEERFGSKGRFAAMHRSYSPMQNALFAGDCWQVDGTRVNFLEHTHQGEKQFLYIIAVRDVHSGEIVGWHFDTKEDRWAVHNAIRMAVRETGYLPHTIVFDRFPGHNTPEMEYFIKGLEVSGTQVKFTHKAEGKAAVERWFGTLQSVFMMESKWYYGEGVKSRRKYAHRSAEYITQLRKEANQNIAKGSKEKVWNFDTAVDEANKVIEAYRNTALCEYSRKHKTVQLTPAEIHEQSEKPHVRPVEEHQFWFLFGMKVKLPIKNEGLIIKEIAGAKFHYQVTDYNIISNYSHVMVSYDIEDLSQVLLYEISDAPMMRFLGRATEVNAAQPHGKNQKWNPVGKREALRLELAAMRAEELQVKKAVGSDIVASTTNMLAPMSVTKHVAEASETKELHKMWGVKNTPPIPRIDEPEEDIDIRNQY